jgi:hypothetical protein
MYALGTRHVVAKRDSVGRVAVNKSEIAQTSRESIVSDRLCFTKYAQSNENKAQS